MKLTKQGLQELYDSMSLDEMAAHVGMSKSTLYYHMKKLGVARRSKSDAQRKHIDAAGHQRVGSHHSTETKEKISTGTKEFWESDRGKDQKAALRNLRRQEWANSTGKKRSAVLARLQEAHRPEPGELSNFGKVLSAFLSSRERVSTGIRLTNDHVSDIILEDRKVVVELIFPIRIYGEKQQHRLEARYERLCQRLNAAGYRVMVIEDKSNSVSQARCKRVYDELCLFFKETQPVKTIVS
jgi:predicted DNA-binding transcriptional regulator AlpA